MNRADQWIMFDSLKRKLFLKHEMKKIIMKSIIKNSKLPLTYRYLAFYFKIQTPRWSNISQIINRCVKTGRSMSVTKHLRYSRFVFRIETYNGNVPGFKRASW